MGPAKMVNLGRWGNMVEVVNLWNLEIVILKNYHTDNGQLIEVVNLEGVCAFTAGLLNGATCLSYISMITVSMYLLYSRMIRIKKFDE